MNGVRQRCAETSVHHKGEVTQTEGIVHGKEAARPVRPGGDDPVDVLSLDAGVLDRLLRRFEAERVRGPLEIASIRRRADADDGDLVLQRISSAHYLAPFAGWNAGMSTPSRFTHVSSTGMPIFTSSLGQFT